MEYEILIRMDLISYFLIFVAIVFDKRIGTVSMMAVYLVSSVFMYMDRDVTVIRIPVVPKHQVELEV